MGANASRQDDKPKVAAAPTEDMPAGAYHHAARFFVPQRETQSVSVDNAAAGVAGFFRRYSSEGALPDETPGDASIGPANDFFVPAAGGCTSPVGFRAAELLSSSLPHNADGAANEGNGSSSYYKGSSLGAKEGAIHCEGFATRQELTHCNRGLVIAMVGLPGRGKSFISRKLEAFLRWQCLRIKTFNVGKYRRGTEDAGENSRADFFDSSNVAATEARERWAKLALDDVLAFLDSGSEVAIFDATNSTAERRQMIVNKIVAERGGKYRVLFVEVVCNDPEVVMTNMKNKVLHSPDFSGMTFEEGLADLQERMHKYEQRYETIDDDTMSYIKLYNMSTKVLVNRIYGSIAQSLMPYMMGIHIGTRPIWLVRVGRAPVGKKQDVHLTESGCLFAKKVGVFLERRVNQYFEGNVPDKSVKVLSSTVPTAVQTVLAALHATSRTRALHFKQTSALNPIDKGRMSGPWWTDSWTDKPPLEELAKRDQEFYAKWTCNRLRTRFPGGESYYDIMIRASGVLLEIEMATRPVLCVSHPSVLQVLVAYFQGTALEDAWDVSIPETSVIEITPTLGGSFGVEFIPVDDEVVDPSMKPRSPDNRSNSHAVSGKAGRPDPFRRAVTGEPAAPASHRRLSGV